MKRMNADAEVTKYPGIQCGTRLSRQRGSYKFFKMKNKSRSQSFCIDSKWLLLPLHLWDGLLHVFEGDIAVAQLIYLTTHIGPLQTAEHVVLQLLPDESTWR